MATDDKPLPAAVTLSPREVADLRGYLDRGRALLAATDDEVPGETSAEKHERVMGLLRQHDGVNNILAGYLGAVLDSRTARP